VWEHLKTTLVDHLINDDNQFFECEDNIEAIKHLRNPNYEDVITYKKIDYNIAEFLQSFGEIRRSIPKEWGIVSNHRPTLATLDDAEPWPGYALWAHRLKTWWPTPLFKEDGTPTNETAPILDKSHFDPSTGPKGKYKRIIYYTLDKNNTPSFFVEENNSWFTATRDVRGIISKNHNDQIEQPEESIPAVRWGKGHKVSEYPHPAEYSLDDQTIPLDKLSVKALTRIFSLKIRKPPNCIKKWDNTLIDRGIKTTVNWHILGERYNTAFLSTKDFNLHFKHITHRAVYTRNRIYTTAKKQKCRLCNDHKETSTHLGRCQVIQKLFRRFNSLAAHPSRLFSKQLYKKNTYTADAPDSNTTITDILFLLPREGVAPALGALAVILWKHIRIAFYQLEIEKKSFIPDIVWKKTIARFADLCLAQEAKAKILITKAKGRGDNPPSLHALNKHIEPIAQIGENGRITFSDPFKKELTQHNLERYVRETPRPSHTLPRPTTTTPPNYFRNWKTTMLE
jgi:hypothetical protein